MRSYRLAILNSHPVQYFAPLYRRLAQEPDINLTVLAAGGLPVTVRGPGWEPYRNRHQNFLIKSGPVWGQDYARAICATKINLCFLRKVNRERCLKPGYSNHDRLAALLKHLEALPQTSD